MEVPGRRRELLDGGEKRQLKAGAEPDPSPHATGRCLTDRTLRRGSDVAASCPEGGEGPQSGHLGARSGVTRSTISRLEQGHQQTSRRTQAAIAATLGFEVAVVFRAPPGPRRASRWHERAAGRDNGPRQGDARRSKRAYVNGKTGRIQIVDDRRRGPQWRQDVQWAARQALGVRGPLLTGPRARRGVLSGQAEAALGRRAQLGMPPRVSARVPDDATRHDEARPGPSRTP